LDIVLCGLKGDCEVSVSVDDVLKRIAAVRGDVPRKEVLARLDVERKRVGGLISDASLLRVIAAELGVTVLDESGVEVGGLCLADLFSGLNGINVVGRVVGIFGSKAFSGVKSGRFASVLIADRSGVARVVLWNNKAGLVESGELKVGQVVRFEGCYSKEDRRGNVELHFGEKGKVVVDPSDVNEWDFPDVAAFLTRIGDLGVRRKRGLVNVMGDVLEVFSVSTFERRNSGVGKVMRVVLGDGSGRVSVVIWNEWVDLLEKRLVVGVGLRLVCAKLKKDVSGKVELHVDSGTYAEFVESTRMMVVPVADLREGMSGVSVEGFVANVPVAREVRTSNGEIVSLATFELKDDSGGVWVSAWRQHVETVKGLRVGANVRVEDAYVKKGFGDQLEVTTRDSTRIRVKH
jgi:replication factor A1